MIPLVRYAVQCADSGDLSRPLKPACGTPEWPVNGPAGAGRRPRYALTVEEAFPDLPGWIFYTDELSAGAYRVGGMDRSGRRVDVTGSDPEGLLEDCRRWAARVASDDGER